MPAAETTAGSHLLATGLSGVFAIILTTLGVDAQAMVWGLIGSTLGATGAPKDASRIRSACVFVATALAAALIGTAAAEYWKLGVIVRNVMTLSAAVVFHPALTVVVTQLPDIFRAVRRRVGLGDQAKDQS